MPAEVPAWQRVVVPAGFIVWLVFVPGAWLVYRLTGSEGDLYGVVFAFLVLFSGAVWLCVGGPLAVLSIINRRRWGGPTRLGLGATPRTILFPRVLSVSDAQRPLVLVVMGDANRPFSGPTSGCRRRPHPAFSCGNGGRAAAAAQAQRDLIRGLRVRHAQLRPQLCNALVRCHPEIDTSEELTRR